MKLLVTVLAAVGASSAWGNVVLGDFAGGVMARVSVELVVQDADINVANSYDDAWESGPDGWVAYGRSLQAAWTGTTGLVVHLGDSITYSNPYGQWARHGSGKTPEDVAICNWMYSGIWGDGTNYWNSGWYLAAYDVPNRGGSFTAKGGARTDQYLNGTYLLPSMDQMYTAGFTNPDGKQYRDAQIAVIMLGTNDASASRSTASMIADLEAIANTVLANNTIVVLSTIPPKRNDMTDVTNYNAAIRNLAQTRKLPLIDYYAEILRRRPGDTWDGTLISSDGVHPSATGGIYNSASNPYESDGLPLSEVGYLLRGWLSVQKIQEIKSKVIDTPLPALLPGACEPPADGTLAKERNNCLWLTFDAGLTLPGGAALSIVNLQDSTDVSGSFTYALDPNDPTGQTLKADEFGQVLVNRNWYRVTPGAGLNVQAFVLDVCTLRGDADGNGQVTSFDYFPVKNHPFEITYARYDLDGDAMVTSFDYFVVKNHPFDTKPPKP